MKTQWEKLKREHKDLMECDLPIELYIHDYLQKNLIHFWKKCNMHVKSDLSGHEFLKVLPWMAGVTFDQLTSFGGKLYI